MVTRTIEVSSLNIYPLKGGRGIPVTELPIDPIGPRHDRRWVVVDADGVQVTQREIARLCQIVARPVDGRLRLGAPYEPTIEVPEPGPTEARRTVQVWDDAVEGVDAGDDAARWLTQFLGADVRLAFCPETTARRTDSDYD